MVVFSGIMQTPDSGGECGIPYETYFPMPTPEQDKPWYSIEQGSVHFIMKEPVWFIKANVREHLQKMKMGLMCMTIATILHQCRLLLAWLASP